MRHSRCVFSKIEMPPNAMFLLIFPQCIVQQKTPKLNDDCIRNLTTCEEGMSFSIYEKIGYDARIFDFNLDHRRRYSLSTGGDFDLVTNKSYPGFSLYREGFDICATVVTHHDVWYVSVRGQTLNTTWINVGATWSKQAGLELFVQTKLVGQALLPLKRPESGVWDIQPPFRLKNEPDKPALMIGCTRTVDNEGYRDYGNSAYDEPAIWTRKLLRNQSYDEILFFTGGSSKY